MDKVIKNYIEAYFQLDENFQTEVRERVELIDATFKAFICYNNNKYATQRQKDILLSNYRKNVKRIETLTKVEYPNINNEELDEYIKMYLNN